MRRRAGALGACPRAQTCLAAARGEPRWAGPGWAGLLRLPRSAAKAWHAGLLLGPAYMHVLKFALQSLMSCVDAECANGQMRPALVWTAWCGITARLIRSALFI